MKGFCLKYTKIGTKKSDISFSLANEISINFFVIKAQDSKSGLFKLFSIMATFLKR